MKSLFKYILICIIAFIVFAPSAHAQTALITPNGLGLDTASQAAAEAIKTPIVKGTAKTFSIVLKTLKISGTIAGTISWQGSNNGVDYAPISSTALVDLSTNYEYKETDKGFLYYRALITQTGTSSLSYTGTYYITVPRIGG